jgi:hypothetical protein
MEIWIKPNGGGLAKKVVGNVEQGEAPFQVGLETASMTFLTRNDEYCI